MRIRKVWHGDIWENGSNNVKTIVIKISKKKCGVTENKMWEILEERNSLTPWDNLGTGGSVVGCYNPEGRAGSIPDVIGFFN
jgi:hypothetical protein